MNRLALKLSNFFCKWCLFSYDPNFSSDACSAKQEFRQFRRMDPKQCQGIFVLWKHRGFVVWISNKSPRSRFVTCHLVVFRWLLRLLATPPPYRCSYGKERMNWANLKEMSKKYLIGWHHLFRKSLSGFRNSSQLCSAGRLSSTGTQVNTEQLWKYKVGHSLNIIQSM